MFRISLYRVHDTVKINEGDENSASEMAKFFNKIDYIGKQLGVSIACCHHHSKGSQGGKFSIDRASGSGVFARDPDAILDLRELSVAGLTDKYRELHPKACGTLTGWELNGTLREFPPMETRRVWFDYPIHVPDAENFLGAANYSDSGETGRGTGKGQKEKTDWFKNVDELLELSQDSAVSLEAVGIKESNARDKFSKSTDYEVATVDGVKVVHRRKENVITYAGETYYRKVTGNISKWSQLPVTKP